MKKRMLALIVGLCILPIVGCQTVIAPDGTTTQTVDAYRLGRFVTIAYLSQKERLEPKYVLTIETVYAEFKKLVEKDDMNHAIRDNLLAVLQLRFKDNPEISLLANEIVELYWKELTAKYNVEELIGDKRMTVLRDFNRGIQAAIQDWNKFATTPDE